MTGFRVLDKVLAELHTRTPQKYDLDIFEVCRTLHGASCGSGDGMTDYVRGTLECWLRLRLTLWDNTKSCSYDKAIRTLVMETLLEGGGL